MIKANDLVVLPTFILERRSLLEMYSDFFAHADFFTQISTLATEQERMIAVIKWYLTSFHAGRNGSVAKKVNILQVFVNLGGQKTNFNLIVSLAL